MKRTKSNEYFHQKPENWNCAQAILKGFQRELNIPESRIAEFKAHGGGRAPNRICGALYAADILMKEQGKNSIEQEFNEQVGEVLCLQIKEKSRTSCKDCVAIADRILEKYIL